MKAKNSKYKVGGRKKIPTDKALRNQVIFRLKDDDYQSLFRDFENSGFNTISEYLRIFFLKAPRKPQRINSAALLKQLGVIGTEISRIGNNINQVTRQANRMNKTGKIHPGVFTEFNKLMTEYLKSRRDLVKAYRAIMKNN